MSHTIAAISTGTAVSAIGIIRMTGDDCIEIAGKVFTLNNRKSLTEAPDRKLMLGELRDALAERDIRFSFTEEAAELIAKNSYSRKYGARNLRRYIRSEVEDKLAELIISGYDKNISVAVLSVRDSSLAFDLL